MAKQQRPPQRSFQDTLAAAVADITEHGFDSMERIERWTRELRMAAERSLVSPESIEEQLRQALALIYRRMVDQGGYARFQPGVPRFTIDRVKPELRNELDRRIRASANLIRLNRAEAIEKTLRRFQGWSTSVPPGGVTAETRAEVRSTVRKSLASLPFEERRVIIDQGAKLTAAINDVIALDGGAIAGIWVSNWRQPGYQFRPEHKERDRQTYLIRDSWAHRQGLVKKGAGGYTDEITAPAQEPFCRCVPGSTRIPFANIEVASRRWYDGPTITITTVSGRRVTCTPNHPILSMYGWRAAETFQPGDYVVEIQQESVELPGSETNQNYAIPTAENIFNSLMKLGICQTRPGTANDFHGDGILNHQVDIVTAARPLMIDCISSSDESINKFLFALPDPNRTFASPFFQSPKILFWINELFTNTLAPILSNFIRFLSHPQQLSLGYIAQGYSSRNQSAPDGDRVNSKFFGNWLDALTSDISLHDFRNIKLQASAVAQIDRGIFNGHVYNFQTSSGAYVAEGIVTHNCYYRYIYNLRDLPESMLTSKGKAALEAASVQTARMDDTGKSSQIEAAYSPTWRNKITRCQRCSMFRWTGTTTEGNSCTAVEGEISAHGHCKFFEIASEPVPALTETAWTLATELDRLGYAEGLAHFDSVPDHDEWHASYEPDTDTIEVEAKLQREPLFEQIHVLLHEIGHRGQAVDRKTFEAFKAAHLDRIESFRAMANPVHMRDAAAHGVRQLPDEVFAESYARFMLKQPMPEDLAMFWRHRFSIGDDADSRLYAPSHEGADAD